MATIKDVAKECGVSVTTVSLIINGKAKERRISEETCERVHTAMKKLGYRPNAGARALRASDDARPIFRMCLPNLTMMQKLSLKVIQAASWKKPVLQSQAPLTAQLSSEHVHRKIFYGSKVSRRAFL